MYSDTRNGRSAVAIPIHDDAMSIQAQTGIAHTHVLCGVVVYTYTLVMVVMLCADFAFFVLITDRLNEPGNPHYGASTLATPYLFSSIIAVTVYQAYKLQLKITAEYGFG